ncbi:DUF5711 family protein [Candidatus Merdisoma sp. JLR.KK006]|uniref:DUF5711 family protein n=1 Tax=Candidatus Merdisoma sp. JLR.KK006 TaxID=3112626 RepID=UPI002FEE9677
MAKITPLYKTPETAEDMKSYKEKLFRHRAGIGVKGFVCAAVVAGLIFGMWSWSRYKTYTTYELLSSNERTDTLNTQYAEYNGKILKYSRDGISCVNLKNEALWSQTYNMQMPILDICQNSVVVADMQGNEAYVFNEDGLRTQITTLLPIQQVSVSSQGVTAMLLSDNSASWICLYDDEGEKLTEARCRLAETGQPLAIGISSDGIKLAVSYLQIQGGTSASCIVFYNFGTVGGNFVDKIVASKVYEERIIPRIEYMGDSICVAMSDKGIIYYEGKEIPEEIAEAKEETEIRSVFVGTENVGVVVEGTGKESAKYEVHLYDTSGNLVLNQETNLAYGQVKMSGSSLIIFNESECEIYSRQGVLRYTGNFDGTIADIYKGSGMRKYIFVFSDRTDEVKLK